MIGQITSKQGAALAKFLHELRPEWDTPGISDALWQARGFAPVGELAAAAIRATLDHANRTPKIIALDGPHWRGGEAMPRIPTPNDAERCSICSETLARCRRLWSQDHDFQSVTDRKRNATRRAP